MQTFLPYESFQASAEALDYRRLGKQRVEAYQILKTLHTLRAYNGVHGGDPNQPTKGLGWKNHPAVLMWQGHERTLVRYALTMCAHWKLRGYKDNLYGRILDEFPFWPPGAGETLPPWLGFHTFHFTHRANLVRKDPEYYTEKFPDVSPDEATKVPYLWPRGQGPMVPTSGPSHGLR